MSNDGYLTTENAQRTLSRLELRCPPLPQTLVEAMDLIEHPEKLEVGPVAEMVQRDPVVIARLLHIVNSAYYGLRHSISSAERAVVMLGPVAVAGIVVGMNMLKLRKAIDGPVEASFNSLIRHSLATAFLTRHLLDGSPRDRTAYARQNPNRIGVSFTAGLLHDFGKIILVFNYPTEAVEFYQKQTLIKHVEDPDLRVLEQLLFGYDHTEAGEFVARKLNFPDLLVDVIRLHHEPVYPTGTTESDQLLRATSAANLASKAMGYAFTQAVSWEEAARNEIWTLLIENDLRHMADTELLIAEIAGLQEHLDLYVQNMMSGPPPEAEKKQVAVRSRLHLA